MHSDLFHNIFRLTDNLYSLSLQFRTTAKIFAIKDGAYYCYCADVLRISRYSDFLSPMLTNRPIRLTQCCTQFRSFGNKTFCSKYFHMNATLSCKCYIQRSLTPRDLNWVQHCVSRIGLYRDIFARFQTIRRK